MVERGETERAGGGRSRRGAARLPLATPVLLDQGAGRALEAQVVDLSPGGLGVSLVAEDPGWLEPGALVRCMIDHRHAPPSSWARVVWVDGVRGGLELVKNTPKEGRGPLGRLLAALELSTQGVELDQMPGDRVPGDRRPGDLGDSGTWHRPGWGCAAGAMMVPPPDRSLGRLFSAGLVVGMLVVSVLTAVLRAF